MACAAPAASMIVPIVPTAPPTGQTIRRVPSLKKTRSPTGSYAAPQTSAPEKAVVKALLVTSIRTAGMAGSSTPAKSGPPTPFGTAGETTFAGGLGCASASSARACSLRVSAESCAETGTEAISSSAPRAEIPRTRHVVLMAGSLRRAFTRPAGSKHR